MKPICWSFGMQSRGAFHIGDHPALEEAVAAAAEAGIEEAIIFGKDHTGFCFHPTDVGIPHPNLKINLTGRMTELLHQHQMKAIAYMNFGLDGEMGRRHPEWLEKTEPGQNTLLTEDHFAAVCIFSEYTSQYMIPVIEEMFKRYHVDGIFLDNTFAFDPCYCPVCQKAFRRQFNRDLPSKQNMDDPGWKLFGPWQYERVRKFIQQIRDAVHRLVPDAPVIFNHVGGPLFPHPMPGVVEGPVSGDPLSQFPFISRFANYFSAFPHTSDIFIERFMRGWGDRGACDDLTLEYKSAIIFSHRCRFVVGDRMHPDARLAPGSLHAMKHISSVWNRMNPFLPDSLTKAPDFLLLYAESRRAGNCRDAFTGFLSLAKENDWTSSGAFRMMMDCGRSFLITPEFLLNDHLKPGRVLILPDVTYLLPETNSAIEEFLRQGGTVLAVGTPPRLQDQSIPSWLGIQSVSDIPAETAIYLPEPAQGAARPDTEKTMVWGKTADIRTVRGETLLYGYPQEYAHDLKKTTYAYYNSSAATPSRTPLLTRCTAGGGKAYFLNCNLFRDYADCALPEQRKWMISLLKEIHPEAAFELCSDSGNMEIISYEDGPEATVHMLLNHGGRDGALSQFFRCEHIVSPQPVYPCTLKIKSPVPLHFTINGQPVSGTWQNGIASLELKMDSVWKAVRAEQ